MRRVPTDPDPTDPRDDGLTPRQQQSRRQGLAYQASFEAVVAILIAAGAGYWADDYFETSPVFLILGTVLGFASFVLRLLRLGRQLQIVEDEDPQPPQPPTSPPST
jgi:F0F1-type ATP synthase assembly protein I